MNDKRNTFTRSLLINSGLKKNMRVLDVGCGAGEVSLLIHEIIGTSGEIVGIDINENSIKNARTAVSQKNISNIQFMLNGIEDLPDNLEPFDAIVGRRVLMYLPNPFESVRGLLSYLKPGGLMIFQESDAVRFGAADEKLPKHAQVQEWIWNTILKENGNIHIGSELYSMFKKAGLNVKDIQAEAVLQTPENIGDMVWLMRMMLPRILRAGVAAEAEIDIDNLEKVLIDEMNHADTVFIRDMHFGICAVK